MEPTCDGGEVILVPRGKFSIEEFDGLFIVALKPRPRYTIYYAREVKPYNEALKHFWRLIGAE